jgi:hypothetical protein
VATVYFFFGVFLGLPNLKIEKNQISKKYTCWRVPHLCKYECKGTIDCTAAFLSSVKYSLTFPGTRQHVYFLLIWFFSIFSFGEERKYGIGTKLDLDL